MAWVYEQAVPFVKTGTLYFSPIVTEDSDLVVYVIDQGTNFYKYNITTNTWTQLTGPTYSNSGLRSLALSPDGLKLACPSDDRRRIEIYTISGDSWAASAQTPNIYKTYTAYINGVVWESDNDDLWAMCYGVPTAERNKFLHYDSTGDTWTVYPTHYIQGTLALGDCVAIASDDSAVYATGWYSGGVHFVKYTVATDTYVELWAAACDRTCACDRSNLWFHNAYYPGPAQQFGYYQVSDETIHEQHFPDNPDETATHPFELGVHSAKICAIYWARTSAPELMSYTVVGAPTVSTNPASSVESDKATLNGELDSDGGEACACGFEWGETIGYGNTTPTQSRTTGQTFAQTISGLDPNKTYHFRAFATNSAGTGHGDDRTFTTLAVAPTVATNPAIDINNDSATLKGELTYDGGEACNCGFEYGETDAYGTTTPTQSKVTGEAFSQPITGLDANKTYHFRAIAINSAGTSHGADRTFKTLVSAPAVTTKPATGLGAVLATLNGTLDDDIGEACECGFEWGLDTDYGVITPTETKTAVDTFSQVIGGLIPNTVYHFRALATNSAGTGHGADRTFTTALVISRAFALAREEL